MRADSETRVAIPDWFWDYCLDDPDTLLNWGTGVFAGKGIIDGQQYRVRISGVEFEVGAIVDIEAIELRIRSSDLRQPETAATDSRSSVPTGRRLSERWRPWIAELVLYIHNNGVPEGAGSQGQEELIKAVADAMAERGEDPLSRSSVQPVVQAVLDRLRSAKN